jgi:gluconate 2-dehydrogenase gamma chain
VTRSYECFGPDEASFVETMVNRMCPADELTPSGDNCGLAAFVDRRLAGGVDKGGRLYMRVPRPQGAPQHGYQLPLTPEQCAVMAGKVLDERVPLASGFNELIYPLFVQACFADPIYGGNVGKVFWKMIGYPDLPATHAGDTLDFRGKPDPDAADPKSIPQLRKRLSAAHFALGEDLEEPAVIERHASEAGIDLAALKVAVANGSAEAAAKGAEMIGRKYSLRGTPAWLPAQRVITEFRPAPVFERLAADVIQLWQ